MQQHLNRSPSSDDSPRRGSHRMSLLDGSAISSILLFSPAEMRHHRLPMPLKLYAILNTASPEVVSWLPDGRSFQVHNPERLERDILSQYFDYDYGTFVRLLALWNFEAGLANVYRHEYLVRGFPELLCSMHLSSVNEGIPEPQVNLESTSPPIFLPSQDSMNHASPLPILQPRLAFGGSPFAVKSQSPLIPPSQTSILFRKQHVLQSLTTELSSEKAGLGVVSPTSVCASMTCEASYSPPTKKRRWLPSLGPASADQPLFPDVECSEWFSTNPELFATLAESRRRHYQF